MNTNGVARHYGRIEADERFRLALRAAARDDHEELERLLRTCPEKTYKMNDAEFVDRGESARLLAVLVIGEVRPHFARASLLRASAEVTRRALVLGAESALEALEGTPSEEELAEMHEAVDESSLAKGFDDLIAGDLAEAAAVWRAFASICEDEMGVDAETVIAATFGREFAAAHAEEFAEVAAADADTELVERWRGVFAERWGSPA